MTSYIINKLLAKNICPSAAKEIKILRYLNIVLENDTEMPRK